MVHWTRLTILTELATLQCHKRIQEKNTRKFLKKGGDYINSNEENKAQLSSIKANQRL